MGFISDQTVTIYQTGMLFLFYRLDRTVLKSHEIHPGIPAEMFTVSHGGDKPAVSHTLAASGFVTGFQTDHQTLGQDMPGIGTVLFFLVIKSEMILDGRIKGITGPDGLFRLAGCRHSQTIPQRSVHTDRKTSWLWPQEHHDTMSHRRKYPDCSQRSE